jgi:hypothetical protein
MMPGNKGNRADRDKIGAKRTKPVASRSNLVGLSSKAASRRKNLMTAACRSLALTNPADRPSKANKVASSLVSDDKV